MGEGGGDNEESGAGAPFNSDLTDVPEVEDESEVEDEDSPLEYGTR